MSRAPAAPPDLPGYDFVRVLGSGGFSDVFLYEQHLPRRRVAVKVLLAESLTPASRAAFIAEANVMAQLSSHPYIVTIYHAGVAGDDRPYLVMEYAPGASLAERYKRSPFTVEDALRAGVRLSSAVATAHAAGILHRDIKPANVLTNEFGWPALTDFGIASATESVLTETTTREALAADADSTGGQSIGLSVPWSPPEMFDDDPQPDVRSDVFSLAATIYTVLAGRTPFEIRGRSNGTVDLIGRIERGAITPFERDDLPTSLVAVLHKGMDVVRERRFSSAVDFARALQRVELELGFTPTAIDVPHLLVEDVRPGDDGSAEETRVRSVATVEAQPRPEAPPVEPTQLRRAPTVVDAAPPPSAPHGESTVLRAQPTVVAEPEPAGGEAAAVETRRDEGRRRISRGLIAGIAGGALAVAATVAVVVVLSTSGLLAPDPVETPGGGDPGGGSAVVEGVAAPEVVELTHHAEDDVLELSVRNPEYQDGDVFRWYLLSNPGRTTVVDDAGEEAVIRVEDVPAGVEVCVGIVVQRAGQLSPAVEECHS